ncbi:MAG: lamin tail domain-containing protein [Candidatus Pacebacteria bacterium]|nr:lamin tail domain-containing protein [Candidatus Paceibacterota bacterium]
MKKAPPCFIILFFLLLFLPLRGFTYGAKTTHPNLSELTINFYNQKSPAHLISNAEKQWIIQGSIEEDDGARSINHFYDSVFNETWEFGGLDYLFPSLTAKEWGQNPFAQAVYDPLYLSFIGPIIKSPVFSRANFTWQKAIYEYVKGNKEMAFKSLGHILHLIQDMSVPEHTRRNVHIFFVDIANSPYEAYTDQSIKSFYEGVKKNLEGLTFLNKISLDEYFDDISLYSNNYFYSPDTILNSKYQLPQPIFLEFPEIQNGKQIFYAMGKDENNEIFHLALMLKNGIGWRLISGPAIFSLEDNQVLEDYWQRLSKKAVLDGAGVINLFFREAEKAKLDPNFISKNEGSFLLAAIGGITDFINNIFQKDSEFILIDGMTDNAQGNIVNVASEGSNNSSSINSFSGTTSSTKAQKVTTTTLKATTTTTSKKTTTTTLKPTTTTTTKTTTTTVSQPNIDFCNFDASQAPSQNKIIINEVAWMGTQDSVNNEWIELKNISSKEIDITNWQLLDKDNQIKVVFEPGAKISAFGYYLLERTSDDSVPYINADYLYTGILNNANERLRLFDNYCNLQDEVFAEPDWPAGDNQEKRTMERKSNLSWQTSAVINGTPKKENSNGLVPSSGGSSPGEGSSSVSTTTTTITTTTIPPIIYPKILITEIKVAGLSSDGKINVYDEFIELFNSNNEEVNLEGWYLQKKTSQAEEFSSLVPSNLLTGKSIGPNDYLLIAHSSSAYAQMADIVISNYSITDNNTIVLKNPNREIVDEVGFGEANECENTCMLNPEPGQSIQRKNLDNNFVDSDNNLNDFEVQNCPTPKGTPSDICFIPSSPVFLTPAIPYITEFSWHPFDKNSSKMVIDFRINSYPFIPATSGTTNMFTAMAFYLNSDFDDASSTFGIPLDYLGNRDYWEIGNNNSGLILTYPNYANNTSKIGSIIFTTDGKMAADSSAPRKLSYRLDQLPDDNHFIVEITGTTKWQSLNFTPDQYVTIGYYGYDKNLTSYLKLIAYDNTKFYFNPSNYYHPPTNVTYFDVECSNESCDNLIFSWKPASDEDPKDILKYDIHYVFAKQGDDSSNNDLTRHSWEWSASQNISGEPFLNSQTNKFNLQVPISEIYYINAKRLPGVPLDVFFGIKARDNEGLKSESPKIIFLHIPPITP